MDNIVKEKIKPIKFYGGDQVPDLRGSDHNLSNLKSLIQYLSRIKNQGLIDDAKFKDLVVAICHNFIENEIEIRVNEKISNSLNALFNISHHGR